MRQLFIDEHAANRIFYRGAGLRHMPVLIRAATLCYRLQLSIDVLMMYMVPVPPVCVSAFGMLLHRHFLFR